MKIESRRIVKLLPQKKKRSKNDSRGTSNQRGRNNTNASRPKKDDKGRPLKKNKNGVYVVDQKKHKASQAVNKIDARLKELESLIPTSDSDTSSSESSDETAHPTPASFVVKARELRSLVNEALNK